MFRPLSPRSGLSAFAPPLRVLLAAFAAAMVGLSVLVVSGFGTPSANGATCSDVDIVFARGTGEAQGLGSVGGPFVSSLTSDLSGRSVSSYAVVYAAASNQSSAGAGSTDAVQHISSVAAACPGTRFVLGGYSQGATVVDKALGISTSTGGTGTAIPSALSGRVAAAVVFGNPLGLQRQTIATASPTYGARSKDYCNTGDPVCGNGSNIGAHLQYVSNGSAAAGAQFAAGLVGATGPTSGPTTGPTSGPTTGPTTGPTSGPTTGPTGTCVRADTLSHIGAKRAFYFRGNAYARGSNDNLGDASRSNVVSLRQSGSTSWILVSAC